MPMATDTQMQAYADQRIRVRAEAFRALLNGFRDDKAAIDDVYDRAANGSAWADARGSTTNPDALVVSGSITASDVEAALNLP